MVNGKWQILNTKFNSIQFYPSQTKPNQTNPIELNWIERIQFECLSIKSTFKKAMRIYLIRLLQSFKFYI